MRKFQGNEVYGLNDEMGQLKFKIKILKFMYEGLLKPVNVFFAMTQLTTVEFCHRS